MLKTKEKKVILVLLVGVFVSAFLVFFADTPPKEDLEKGAVLVSIYETFLSDEKVTVKGFGTVNPRHELSLRPQVTGTVTDIHPAFQQGGRIEEGEVLFQIDKRDYEIALQEQRAALEKAKFEIKLEEGNQIVAKREWELLREDGRVSPLSEELALRKPHLREKEAALRAAESRLKKAELDLERTEMKAPFPAVVIEENIEVGKFVFPQELVGKIVSVNEFDIEVQLQRSSLQWLPDLLRASDKGLDATVIQRIEDGQQFVRSGKAIRLLSDVDSSGRMARILVRVVDPLTRSDKEASLPLLLGTYVEVQIESSVVSDVYKVPTRGVREGGVVWVVDEEKTLKVIPIKEVFSGSNYVYIRGELGEKAQIITSSLPTALEGMKVSIAGE